MSTEQNTVSIEPTENSEGKMKRLIRNFVDGVEGGNMHIILTVVVSAIVFSIMAVNWTKMIYEEVDSKNLIFGVLLVSITIGNACIIILLYRIAKRPKNQRKSCIPESLYELVKLLAAFVFASCNVAHCGFFINKHLHGSPDCTHKWHGVVYNILSILYTIMLFSGILALKFREKSVISNFLSVGILFANVSFWLDTFFSESEKLFKYESDQGKVPDHFDNKTDQNQSILNCTYSKSAMNLIEHSDPILSPGTVEFAIITIDLLFSYAKKEERQNQESITEQDSDKSNTHCCANVGNIVLNIILGVLYGAFSLALIIISLVGLDEKLSEGSEDNKTSDTLSEIFKAYIVTSILAKLLLSFFLNLSIWFSWGSFLYKFGMEGLILMVSCFGNVVYHMFYLFALRKSLINTKDDEVYGYLVASSFENTLSIIIAWEQTLFILATETGEKLKTNRHKHYIYILSRLMAISNIGLWLSDTFGEANVDSLSIIIRKSYNKNFGVVFTKLVLPVTIFFRLHSGLALLKMFSDSNLMDVEYRELEPITPISICGSRNDERGNINANREQDITESFSDLR